MTALETARIQVAVPIMAALAGAPTQAGRLIVPGPELVVVLGVAVPALSALFALVGVVLGQLLAPAPLTPLGWRRRFALVAALLGIAIGIVIASGQVPLVAISWGIGLGFSGLSVAQALGDGAMTGIRSVIDAIVAAIASRIGGKNKDTGS